MRVFRLPMDVTDTGSITNGVKVITENDGKLDVLVNK
jgi:NADP-dependent 3-hydroxy acid dehydrogenase YdfG